MLQMTIPLSTHMCATVCSCVYCAKAPINHMLRMFQQNNTYTLLLSLLKATVLPLIFPTAAAQQLTQKYIHTYMSCLYTVSTNNTNISGVAKSPWTELSFFPLPVCYSAHHKTRTGRSVCRDTHYPVEFPLNCRELTWSKYSFIWPMSDIVV